MIPSKTYMLSMVDILSSLEVAVEHSKLDEYLSKAILNEPPPSYTVDYITHNYQCCLQQVVVVEIF